MQGVHSTRQSIVRVWWSCRLSCSVSMRPKSLPCNTLQHTAKYCNTSCRPSWSVRIGPVFIPCNTLQHTTTHCNKLQRTATCCNTLNFLPCTQFGSAPLTHDLCTRLLHTQMHSECSYTYVYIYTHTHIYIYSYTYLYSYICICMHLIDVKWPASVPSPY